MLLNVVVTDKRNRLVHGLKEEDFVVAEDDAPRRLCRSPRAAATAEAEGTPAAAKPVALIFLLEFASDRAGQ